MSIKVLVFESDSAFAGELRNELGNLGCAVRLVDDGNVGLQQAQTERPDLILLSIELPRMNGFSVCNKLKKDAELKDVPLIIMSSESSDETFEQHKKLRTRAEAYVHKPIAFGDLLQQIEAFVSITGNALGSTGDAAQADDAGDADGIMIDDGEVEGAAEAAPDSGRTAMFQVPRMPRPRQIDPDIDAFADDAFGRLQQGVPPAAPTELPPTPPPPSEPPEGPPSNGGTAAYGVADVDEEDSEVALARAEQLDRVRAEADAALEERDQAMERAQDLEQQLLAAQAEVARIRDEAVAEAERLNHDLEEARSRPPPVVAPAAAPATTGRASVPPKGGVGGVSSREFLDLRETLSKKDKEILALKQQLAVKDKEIFETRERSLAHEGRVSELDDRVLAKDRELAESGDKIEDLGAQLEATTKGLADAKTTLERLEKEHADLREKHDRESVTHEAATAAFKADRAEAEKKLRDDHAAALAKAEAAHRSEIDAAEAAHRAAREQYESEHTAAAEAARRAHTAATEKASADHSAAMDELTQAHANAMDEATRTHATAMEDAKRSHEAALDDLKRGHAAAMEEATRSHAAAAAEAARLLDEATRNHAAATEEAVRTHAAATEEAARQHAEAQAAARAEAEKRLADTVAAREAALKAETDTKLAALHRSQQDELSRLRAEAEARETALKDDLAKATARGDDFQQQTTQLTTVRSTLEGQLGAAASKAIAQDEELTTLRGELEETRKNLARESSRATRAHAKWDADKASLERAKDALAVALSQLDEAEARQISE